MQTLVQTSRSRDVSSCGIRLALDAPTTIVQDQGFPLVLKLRDVIDDPHSPVGTVSFRSSFIQLLQYTMAWADDGYGNRWTERHTLVSRDFSSNGAPQITKEGTDLAALFDNPPIPQNFPPSFKCLNIGHMYGLKVCLNVGFGEQRLGFSFDINPVNLLPGELHCMAYARQQDELWDNSLDERPFPNAVNKLKQKLGV